MNPALAHISAAISMVAAAEFYKLHGYNHPAVVAAAATSHPRVLGDKT